VAFPNPEEDGAMDRALALAASVNADLVLANDPDADRLAVALPNRDEGGQATGYTLLTGNEIGVLLGHDAVKHADTGDAPKLAVTTMVSSTQLSRVARDHGARYAETLTGFKWIADAAIRAAEERGEAFVFGYEQALGYSVGPLVRDKDGVSAAVRFAELVAWLRTKGRTVRDELDRIALRHGPSEGEEWSVRFDGVDAAQRMAGLMRALRQAPPGSLAGEAVVQRTDLATGQRWDADGAVSAIDGPRAELLRFDGERGTRLVVRPSGTEPKVKFYLEAPGAADDLPSLAAERARLRAHLAAIRAQLDDELGLG
jgi:phosphomannomutase